MKQFVVKDPDRIINEAIEVFNKFSFSKQHNTITYLVMEHLRTKYPDIMNDTYFCKLETNAIIDYLIDKGYLKKDKNKTILSNKGKEAIEHGGIIKYERQNAKITREHLSGKKRKKWVDLINIGGGIIGIIGGIFSAFVYFGLLSEKNNIDADKTSINNKFELINKQIDSLKQELHLEKEKSRNFSRLLSIKLNESLINKIISIEPPCLQLGYTTIDIVELIYPR